MTAWWIPALLALSMLPWAIGPDWPRPHRTAPGRLARRRLPWGLGSRNAAARVDAAVLADILGAALQAGAPIHSALAALGRAVPGEQGEELRRVAAALRLGGKWQSAWQQAGPDLQVLNRTLAPAWTDGISPGTLLTYGAGQIRRERAAASRAAAARLGVRLVLPMGLCWLPAFVLLGLVPVLLSTGGSLWP